MHARRALTQRGKQPKTRVCQGNTLHATLSASPAGGRGLGVENPGLGREAIEISASFETELLTKPRTVRLYGLHTQANLVGDLLVGVSLCEEPEHFALAPAQFLRWLRRGVGTSRVRAWAR